MNPETNIALIAAATTAAGPQANYTRSETRLRDGEEVDVQVLDLDTWKATVTSIALDLLGLADERSDLSKAILTIEGAADETNKRFKRFTGAVLRVEKERSSTRGVVTFVATKPTTQESRDAINGGNLPMGQEQFRTERTDNPVGRAMARKMRALIGHRVLVYIDVEPTKGGGRGVRTVRHVVDLGLAAEFVNAA
jgi:hypothetical protein